MEVSGNEMQLCKRHSDQKQFFEGEDVVLALVHVHHRAPHQLHEDLVVGLVELHFKRLWIIVSLLLSCYQTFRVQNLGKHYEIL